MTKTKRKNTKKKETKQSDIKVIDFNNQKAKKEKSNKKEPAEIRKAVVVSLFILLVDILGMFDMGLVGTVINNILTSLFGSFYHLIFISIVVIKMTTALKINTNRRGFSVCGLWLLCFFVFLLTSTITNDVATTKEAIDKFLEVWKYLSVPPVFGIVSGVIGDLFHIALLNLFSNTGCITFLCVSFVASVLLIVPFGELNLSGLFFEEQEEESVKQTAKKTAAQQSAVFITDTNKKQVSEIKEEKKDKTKLSIFNKTEKVNKKDKIEVPIVKTESKKEVKEEKIRKSGDYVFPSLSILDEVKTKDTGANEKAAEIKGQKIIEILKTFDIEATLLNTYIGPSVTKFEIRPKQDVKISKIQSISDNIKMELAAKEIRIEAPIPGKSAVGIEIPNVESVPVKMRNLMEEIPTKLSKLPLVFGVGKGLSGESIYCNLEKLPHALIAGATGSGKSVCINTIITSFLMKSDPKELKLVLIDPKKVEFSPYHDIPHLLWPVITDTKMATMMLQKIVVIMEERYDLMAEVGVRNLQSYNDYVKDYNAHITKEEQPKEVLPRIVVIIDELADLMAVAGKDVELSIQRITQLARAAGIHLIVATQRPSTDVITGLIKSNIPSRISFAVSSSIDSRTILDQTGAEKLLGNGDMLYFPQGENAPVRVQGCYVSDEEIEKVTNWCKQQAKPEYDDTYFEIQNNLKGTIIGQSFADEQDDLYDSVVEFVKEQQKASTSLLQRRFGIGYNRAARLIDTLEDRGIVGPANGSKPREVYIKPEEVFAN